MDKTDKDILQEARERFKKVSEVESENRDQWADDIRFAAGDQWPEEVRRARESDPGGARPCLTIDRTNQHVKQVTNEQRKNKPAIKVIPNSGDAEEDAADVFNGVIRHIQECSDADEIYATGGESQVVCGVGYWRIITDYSDPETGEQEIYLRSIANPLTVYFDPFASSKVGADAMYCFVTEEVDKDKYEDMYKDDPEDWEIDDQHRSFWITENSVRVAEYYRVTEKYKESDGQQITIGRKVEWFKLSGGKVLERTEWAGKFIPVIRCVGEVVTINGRKVVQGLVRRLKDAQRMYNYWSSTETELIALQPKAPFVAAEGAIEGYENDWNSANRTNLSVLTYRHKDDDGDPIPTPQRQGMPQVASGILQAKMAVIEDMKAASGQYNQSLGQGGQATSGIAIKRLQQQGDTSTFHFVDNMGHSIKHTGRVLVDLIPKIYDTKRVIRILGEDGSVDFAEFDPQLPQAMAKVRDPETGAVIKKIYNPTVGKFDVSVIVGPTYSSKRQEASEVWAQFAQGNPQMMPLIGDIIARNMDVPGAHEVAERLKAMLPPPIKELEANEDASPEVLQVQAQAKQALGMAQQQMQQLQQALQQAGQELQQTKAALEAEKARKEGEMAKVQVEAFRAQTERAKTEAEMQRTQMEMAKPESSDPLEIARLQFDKWKTEFQGALAIQLEQMKQGFAQQQAAQQNAQQNAMEPQEEAQEVPTNDILAVSLQGLTEAISQMRAPRTIVRGEDGSIMGIQ
jgi:CheY-like chemotaxis protein